MRLIFIILFVLAALIISTLFLFTGIALDKFEITAIMFQGLDDNGKMKDNMNDTKLITLHKTNIIPKVSNYLDILSLVILVLF